MSKSNRSKRREQLVFVISVLVAVIALALMLVSGQSTTRWLIFAAALMNAVTFGFLRRTH
ncbi:hypothetical protein [Gemmatimonas sp.]|uniref:hypothetical protein n=1 Tax=Gemmatimonas sp. TaxID=1962908 RepID=UPI003982E98B